MSSLPKLIFIGVKVLLIVVMMGFGICAYMMKGKGASRVVFLFIYYIIIMLALSSYELVHHGWIIMLFYIVVFSGIGQAL